MTVTQEQLEEFVKKYPVTEPVQATPELGPDAGSFTTEMLGDRLQAWADAHPNFTFSEGRTSRGPGYYIRCPGDLEGWSDGAIHSDKVGKHTGAAAVWVENGWPRFRCGHSHCDEGAATGKKTWKSLQEYFDPERALHSIKGKPTVGKSEAPQTKTPQTEKLNAENAEMAAAEWFFDADDFLKEELPPRRVLAKDTNGTALLYEKSLNQIFAYRGQGKTMFTHGLVNILVHGGEFLRYTSSGGLKVLIADGELPDIQLQDRIKKLIGPSEGLLKLMSPERMPSHIFPSLSNPDWQAEFLTRAEKLRPNVIVFDTLTACFRFDTNDPDIWLQVNQFFIALRIKGFCVIVVHHAGKSGTQRGRTDGDDNLDLSIKLDSVKGWAPGEGLEIIVSYEKVRAGGHLPGFQAAYSDDRQKWEVKPDEEGNGIVAQLLKGRSIRSIASSLDVDKNKIWRVKKSAEKNGIVFPEVKESKRTSRSDED